MTTKFSSPFRNCFFLATALASLLIGCGKHGSFYEAKSACEKWAEKGGSYTVKGVGGWNQNRGGREAGIRGCRPERETSQILGFEAPVAAGSIQKDYAKREVVKHFRY